MAVDGWKLAGLTVTLVLLPLLVNLVSSELIDWCPRLAEKLVQWAARIQPPSSRETREEEWLGILDETPGKISKLLRAAWIAWCAPAPTEEPRVFHPFTRLCATLLQGGATGGQRLGAMLLSPALSASAALLTFCDNGGPTGRPTADRSAIFPAWKASGAGLALSANSAIPPALPSTLPQSVRR